MVFDANTLWSMGGFLLLVSILGMTFAITRSKGKGLHKSTGVRFTVYAVILAVGIAGLVQMGWIGTGLFDVGGGAGGGAGDAGGSAVTTTIAQVSTGRQVVIETLKVNAFEKHSNKGDQVGNNTKCDYKIYPATTDPRDPNAQTIDKVNLTSGSGTSTNKKVFTDTSYRQVLDCNGGTTAWYDKDFGIITFSSSDYNPNTATLAKNINDVARIGDILDPKNGNITTSAGNTTSGDINGQTAYSTSSEVFWSSSTKLLYDESNADGTFYIKPFMGVDGANREVKDYVICVEWDSSNPPEGNEVTAITASDESGSTFVAEGKVPADFLSTWKTESCARLGTLLGGASKQVKFTITYDEANLDNAGDIWNLRFDDLGSFRGKDDGTLNTGATHKTITFDSQA